MNRNGLLICFFLLSMTSTAVYAANDNYPFGGRQAGMANAAVAIYDLWAISHNQAGLAKLQSSAAGIYFENRYMVREMSLGAAAFAMPVNAGVFGLSLSYFGHSLYHESKVGLAYARSFGERLSAALQFNYMYAFVGGNYNNAAGNVSIEMGMIYEMLPGLHIGAHVFNPTRTKLASVDQLYDEYIPVIMRFGMAYAFSDRVLISVETEKEIDRKAVVKTGIEYQVANNLYVRGGIGTNPTQHAFGFGFQTGAIIIDLSSSFHHVLGYSPQASILYQFN